MGNKVTLTCATCGISFERFPSQVGKGPAYCSMACVGRGKRHGSELFCEFCDSVFYRRFGEQDLGTRKSQFCTRKCYMDWRAANRGPDSYPKTGSVHKHRLVAEKYLGRKLKPEEVVHHKDLNKHNFAPSNLAVLPNQEFHVKVHAGEVTDEELSRFSIV